MDKLIKVCLIGDLLVKNIEFRKLFCVCRGKIVVECFWGVKIKDIYEKVNEFFVFGYIDENMVLIVYCGINDLVVENEDVVVMKLYMLINDLKLKIKFLVILVVMIRNDLVVVIVCKVNCFNRFIEIICE